MKACCVEGCNGPEPTNPVFFPFPSSRLLRRRWLDAIKSPSVEPDAVVCISHFARGDYDLVAGELALRARVVPSRRVGGVESEDSDSESSSESDCNDRTQEKSNKNNKKAHNDSEKVNDNSKKVTNNEENGSKSPTDKILPETDKEKSINGLDIQSNSESNETVQNENEKVQNEGVKDKSNGKSDKSDEKNDKSYKKNDKTDGKNCKSDVKNVNSDGKNDKSDGIKLKIVRGRKTLCKITARRAINGRRRRKISTDSSDSPDSVSSSPVGRSPVEGSSKEDIEEALQHYYIENKKTERQVAAMTDVLLEEQEKRDEEARLEYERELEKQLEEVTAEQSKPVFVEMSVGPGGSTVESAEPANDCLMLLESVQCDVDPALLLAAREEEEENMEKVELDDDDDDDDEPVIIEKKKEDPISLLTSSDEDDVILQEPKIDTVEVSSADTSEDDMPLVKLVKPVKVQDKEIFSAKKAKNLINQLLWGRNDFYCVRCRYTTSSSSEYTKHMASHSKVLQLCHDCGFTSSSKHQMQKHKQKHKNEKRYHCRLCNYSAKHKMSLVYHMKTHNASVNELELAICGTFEGDKSKKSKKSKKKASEVGEKRYKCGVESCDYHTDRRSDMKRHKRRIHRQESDDDDDEYVP